MGNAWAWPGIAGRGRRVAAGAAESGRPRNPGAVGKRTNALRGPRRSAADSSLTLAGEFHLQWNWASFIPQCTVLAFRVPTLRPLIPSASSRQDAAPTGALLWERHLAAIFAGRTASIAPSWPSRNAGTSSISVNYFEGRMKDAWNCLSFIQMLSKHRSSDGSCP